MCYDGKRRNFHYTENFSKKRKIFHYTEILFRAAKRARNRKASWRRHSRLAHFIRISKVKTWRCIIDNVALRVARLDIMTKTTTLNLGIELIRYTEPSSFKRATWCRFAPKVLRADVVGGMLLCNPRMTALLARCILGNAKRKTSTVIQGNSQQLCCLHEAKTENSEYEKPRTVCGANARGLIRSVNFGLPDIRIN